MKISKKWKKCLEISSFNTSVPKILITCFSIPEVWCVTYVIVTFHFELFFCPFNPPNSPKNNNFKKLKTPPGYIIILHMCTKNHDHMLYCSWDMVHDSCNSYFSFWANFCPFTPLTAWKIKISKKMKKAPRDIIISHKYTTNQDHMLYCSWDMVHDRCNSYFSFWANFCPFTPLRAWKIKISKKWKKHLEISSFHTSVPKIKIICYTVPEIWLMMDVIVIFHFGQIFAT